MTDLSNWSESYGIRRRKTCLDANIRGKIIGKEDVSFSIRVSCFVGIYDEWNKKRNEKRVEYTHLLLI